MPIRLCFSFRNFILISAVSILFFGRSACLAQQNVAETCAHGTWAACGVAVKNELDKNPSEPKRIVELAGLWGRSYSVRFDALRKNGKIEKSIPDSDKIFEAVSAKLNPVDIAKDKTVDALSRQVCLAVGCAEGSQNLPDVQTTAVLQLSKVVSPAVWQAFQEWQKSGGHESFSFWILLRPSTGIISTKHENARIVDLRLAAQRNGAEETLHSFDLYHPGVSYIPYRGTIHVDVLKPDHISSALRPSTLGDTTIRNLKEAWIAKDAPPPASRFAGYGMFTEWRLTLEPDQLNKSLNEVVLQIAYRYTPAQADATSEAGESFILRPVGTDLTIEGSTLNALGGQKQLQDKLLRWRSTRETNIPPLSFAAEIEGHQ